MSLAALLVALLPSALAPDAGPERTECYELRAPGVAGEAGSLGGLRRVVRALPSGGWRAERELLLDAEGTRLLQFETYSPAGARLVHREVRAGDGRTVRIAWTPGEDPRPEWVAFTADRRRTGSLPSRAGLLGPLGCVERLRWGIVREREVVIDPLGTALETLLPVERAIASPLWLPLRRVDLRTEEGGRRGSLWFLGSECLGRSFGDGGPVAVRVGPDRYQALLERFEERLRPAVAEERRPPSRGTGARG